MSDYWLLSGAPKIYDLVVGMVRRGWGGYLTSALVKFLSETKTYITNRF
jgi:hypothetical protein